MISLWEKRGAGTLLWPLSLAYRLAVRLRNRRFDTRPESACWFDVPVISIGNLTVGGAGKTPLVMAVAEWIRSEGKRPAILSRGFGRKSASPLIVCDGNRILGEAVDTGDEPLMLARRLRDVPVLVGSERMETGRIAIRRFHPDVLILDDGFQHRKVARDLDAVVLDATCPFGNGWLIPAGPLREPLSALKRADLVVLSRSDQAENTDALVQAVRRWTGAPVLTGRHKPVDWIRLDIEEVHPLDHLRDRFCLAFSGIGNPESFEKTLRSTGIQRLKSLRFRDHHRYTQREIRRIDRAAEEFGAVALVTTEKDAARLGPDWRTHLPVYALRVVFEADGGKETVMRMLSL